MTAGRLYCIQSWNNASETSGEQIGNRLTASKALHFDRLGNANTSLYADEKQPQKPIKSIREKILPQEIRLNNLEKLIKELEQEYTATNMPASEYIQLRSILDRKYERAYELLEKQLYNDKNELTEETSSVMIKTSKQSTVASGVFKGISHDNCVAATLLAVMRTIEKCKRIYRVIKQEIGNDRNET